MYLFYLNDVLKKLLWIIINLPKYIFFVCFLTQEVVLLIYIFSG